MLLIDQFDGKMNYSQNAMTDEQVLVFKCAAKTVK